MKPQDFEAALRKTLDDQRLSRGEKRALRAVVSEARPAELPLLRNIAFRVARSELAEAQHSEQVLTWLEEVNKALIPDGDLDGAPSSQAYFSPGDAPLRKIVGLLAAARRSCDICVFTITDDRIAEAILSCHGRGVALRVVSDDEKAFDRGSDIQRLAKAGVPLRVDRTAAHMHHKFALFDGTVLLTGSYNWTRSAAAQNNENLIVTDDHRLATAFGSLFDRLWEELAP
jgi:cardiolipin hydrolase